MGDLIKGLDGLFPDTFSHEYLDKKITDSAMILVYSPKEPNRRDIQQAVDNLVEELSQHKETWKVIVPVENLELGVPELKVGHVTFRPHQATGELMSFVAKEPEVSQKDFQFVKAYAVVDEDGELGKAFQKGVDDVEMALNALRLWSSPLRRRRGKRRVPTVPRVMGDTPYRSRTIYAVPKRDNRPKQGETLDAATHEMAAIPIPRLIDESRLALWRRFGFERLSNILADRNLTEYEKRIRRAIRWMGEARLTANLEDAFVKNSIALESLLLGPGGQLSDPRASIGSITSQLAERAAFLLGRNGEEREKIVKDIRRLYSLRSKIVHRAGNVNEADLTLWELYIGQCLMAVLTFEFRDIDSLRKWVNRLKFWGEPLTDQPLWRSLYGDEDVSIWQV